jgi:hypothetical protein
VLADSPGKLADVAAYRRRWQRLGERLHPHEHGYFPHAQDVFAVARGEQTARSLAGRVELAFAAGDTRRAVELLAVAPGVLLRQLDRVLRAVPPGELDDVLATLSAVVDRVSGRDEYLTVRYLVDPLRGKAASYTEYTPGRALDQPITFVGIERPHGLPDGSTVITLAELSQLVPE